MPNLNELAREVTLKEGGKVNMTIAQVKEVQRLLLKTLAAMPEEEAIRYIRRYKNSKYAGPRGTKK